MPDKEKLPLYITTTLPYVNSDPHVGFAMEITRADAIARYQKLMGRDIFFNTGTDEHGQKIWTAAQDAKKEPQEYVDYFANEFRGLIQLLGISDDIHFIRTTDKGHEAAAQKLWNLCDERGYIYKGRYTVKYCVGCELEKTDSELDQGGRCLLHPNRDLVLLDEDNYFFALSKVEPLLKDLYEKNPTLVIPDFRYNEMKAFLSRGLQDFSISRSKEKMPWGVAVPGDDSQVMYVWFDALTNYISTLGWGSDDETLYKKFWENGETIQYCGKDNVRQQSLTWQAILLAAGLPTTKHIVIDGFINSGGQKMSKSLGNTINPYDVKDVFIPVAGDLTSDVIRYILLRHTNSFEDSDLTMESMIAYYNANLANGLGNLASRILTMAENNGITVSADLFTDRGFDMHQSLEDYTIDSYMNRIWADIQKLDQQIQKSEPFKVIKERPEMGKVLIRDLLLGLFGVAKLLTPVLPKTSASLLAHIKDSKKPEKPLFQRI